MKKQLQDQRQWHAVFAWWPVVTIDGQRIWLERVERRLSVCGIWEDYYDYRPYPTAPTPKGG